LTHICEQTKQQNFSTVADWDTPLALSAEEAEITFKDEDDNLPDNNHLSACDRLIERRFRSWFGTLIVQPALNYLFADFAVMRYA
jgi:hypothetical protein